MEQQLVNTELKLCAKCGATIPEGQNFCGNCGKKYVEGKKKINPLKFIIPSICVIVVGVIITIILIVINSPINRLDRALNSDDIQQAITVYNENTNNRDFKINADDKIAIYLNSLTGNYGAGKISYDIALAYCETLSNVCDTSETLLKIDAILNSKTSFSSADSAEKEGKYKEAIECYNLVIEGDTEYYSIAQSNIENCKIKYSNLAIDSADKFVAENNYIKAKKELNTVIDSGYATDSVATKLDEIINLEKQDICGKAMEKYNAASDPVNAYKQLLTVKEDYYTSEFTTTLETAKTNAITYAKDTANDYYNKNDYLGGYKYIDKLPTEIINDDIKSLKNELKDQYETSILSQVDKLVMSYDYEGAIKLLNDANNNIKISSFTTRKNQCQKAADIAYLDNLPYNVYVKYDDIDDDYTIRAYSTNYYSDFATRSTYPSVVISSGTPYFRLTFGFSKKDWIFMEKIIVDCDGSQTTFTVDYFDRDTDVSGGYIYETWTVLDSDSEYSFSTQFKDLTSFIEKLEKANTVKIRFKGDDGALDRTLSDQEVNKIINMWNIYQILERDSSLLSYLK